MNKCLFFFALALVLSGHVFASESATNHPPRASTAVWRYIHYPESSPGSPTFLLTSGEQWGQASRGLRLDILHIAQGFAFLKTNTIVAHLHRADGEVVEPATEGKKLLNSPVAAGSTSPGEELPPQVMTYFPWGSNALQEAWLEVSIASERYWLEIPYGLDRHPSDPLPPSVPGGTPHFAHAMKSLTEHDHILRWENVHYHLGQTPDKREVVVIQSNPFDAHTSVDLYRFPERQDLFSSHTSMRLLRADGNVRTGQCVNLHLDDNHLRRTDTFDLFDRGGDDALRSWGQIEIKVDDATYRVTVPSSLFKYVHGHAHQPAAVDFISTLRVGMTLKEIERGLQNYNLTRKSAETTPKQHEYHYLFTPNADEVTLRFDQSNQLVSWK